MYPTPPQSHRPTNYYGILVAGVVITLLLAAGSLRALSARLPGNAAPATAQPGPAAVRPRPGVTPLVIAPTAVPVATA
ncbi:MAG: hypothetical protein KGJ86_18300, partial [Chloroflexota bacterium]|nr:hypothetical protein [Chloroflexota bacterium]